MDATGPIEITLLAAVELAGIATDLVLGHCEFYFAQR